MIESISVENFKNLAKLEVSGLSRITLIGGQNNCGKTSLLEALSLAFKPSDTFTLKPLFRGFPSDAITNPWASLFYKNNLSQNIRISLPSPHLTVEVDCASVHTDPKFLEYTKIGYNFDILKIARLKIFNNNYEEIDRIFAGYRFGNEGNNKEMIVASEKWPNSTNTHYMDTRSFLNTNLINHLFSKIIFEDPDEKDTIIKFIEYFEPKIRNIEILQPGNAPFLYFVMESGSRFPALSLGDGLQRLTQLMLILVHIRDGILLVDEIDNGLHHSGLANFWSGLSRTARRLNNQIIATTHSYECLQAALEGCKEFQEDLTFIRLDKDDSGIVQPVSYDYESLSIAASKNWEVR